MGFPRKECWSGLPFLSPGHLLDPGIESTSPVLAADDKFNSILILNYFLGKYFFFKFCYNALLQTGTLVFGCAFSLDARVLQSWEISWLITFIFSFLFNVSSFLWDFYSSAIQCLRKSSQVLLLHFFSLRSAVLENYFTLSFIPYFNSVVTFLTSMNSFCSLNIFCLFHLYFPIVSLYVFHAFINFLISQKTLMVTTFEVLFF